MRRKGKKTSETVYLISSLTLEQLNALGWIKLKRGYWVIESRLHHALDVSLDEDRSRVRNANAALLSEAALAEDWNRPEEDAAWAHLQPGKSS